LNKFTTYTDQMGRDIIIPNNIERIVSLVPSQTEYLYSLGLGHKIVGQTVFCIHPQDEFKNATKIGGTKKLQIEKIRALNPDLIIGNKEENDKIQIETLAAEFPVWMSDINTYPEAIGMMQEVANILSVTERGEQIVNEIDTQWERVRGVLQGSMLYLIWNEPYMAVGTDTFINHLCEHLGLKNTCISPRYPSFTSQEIANCNADYIFLSSEPYPFDNEDIKQIQTLNPKAKVVTIDGEICSWYGSRLTHIQAYFDKFIKVLEG
jgi:ABC-type Fe3+-hydroxamate transport system substrate-binding protein